MKADILAHTPMVFEGYARLEVLRRRAKRHGVPAHRCEHIIDA